MYYTRADGCFHGGDGATGRGRKCSSRGVRAAATTRRRRKYTHAQDGRDLVTRRRRASPRTSSSWKCSWRPRHGGIDPTAMWVTCFSPPRPASFGPINSRVLPKRTFTVDPLAAPTGTHTPQQRSSSPRVYRIFFVKNNIRTTRRRALKSTSVIVHDSNNNIIK